MCDIVFEKTKGHGGTVNRTSVYAEAVVFKRFCKKTAMRNFAEFTRKYLCRNLLFDKVKLCTSSTSLKMNL